MLGPATDPVRVASGVSDDGTFELSNLKTVGEYVLSIKETDCDDESDERYESKTVT